VKRLLSVAVGLIVVGALIAGGLHFVRLGRARSMPTNSAGAAPADEPAPLTGAAARGTITIDPRRQQLIGIRIVAATRKPLQQTVRTVGVVRHDETRQSDINVKVDGWIRDLYADYTGQPIQRGQPLFTLYSPELLSTQQEYLLALKTRDLVRDSVIADARDRADQLVASARQRLTLWDLSPDDIRTLEDTRTPTEVTTFRSPSAGVVVEKQALKGLHVTAGQSLYRVSDLSVVWVEADIYERDLAVVHAGATATVTVDAYPGERFNGRVIYTYPYLDDKTRTNKLRFELPNRNGRLKPGMYATVDLSSAGSMAVTVPTDAVLDSGPEQVVFIARGDGVFDPRKVKIGRRVGEEIEILDGLQEGEQVATGAAFFLDSESQLRASLHAYEASAPPARDADSSSIQIAFRTMSDPARTGDNALEATVTDSGGKAIDDATVTVQFFMPAMPTMNMPAMRSEATLAAAGSGVYRGTGQIMMAGRWDATVTVTRAGQRLGTKQLPIVAR
jgi:Cu(I)/Ag(I) efflux system membrane fusion protein